MPWNSRRRAIAAGVLLVSVAVVSFVYAAFFRAPTKWPRDSDEERLALALAQEDRYFRRDMIGDLLRRFDVIQPPTESAGDVAKEILDRDGARAIPKLIGLIDADNSSWAIFIVGNHILGEVTKVTQDPFHDGAWWRRWWAAHRHEYPADVRETPIPEFDKTEYGRRRKPFPDDVDTLQGKLRLAPELLAEWATYDRANRASIVEPRVDRGSFAGALRAHRDLHAIPYLIGLITADGTADAIYRIGYFGLGGFDWPWALTDVKFDESHDGTWWRQWWEENRGKYPADVRDIEIPDYKSPLTFAWKELAEEDKQRIKLADEIDVPPVERLFEALAYQDLKSVQKLAQRLAEYKGLSAVPTLIGVIDADNSYETVYGLGHDVLKSLTGVSYSPFHDGAWWRRWWAENGGRLLANHYTLPFPELPKTEHGLHYTSFPENSDSLQGKLLLAREVLDGELARWQDATALARIDMASYAMALQQHADPHAIPYLIGLLEALPASGPGDGLTSALRELTGVERKTKAVYDAAWWRQWWQEHKANYPVDVRTIEIPDYQKPLTFAWHEPTEEEKRQTAPADVAEIPAAETTVAGNDKMRYFLIGPRDGVEPPTGGFKLVVVMPGGNGGEDFHPFVRRLYKNAMTDEFLVAQPVAVAHAVSAQVVWPTRHHNIKELPFTTEEFVEAVIKDVANRYAIDKRFVFTLSWSSSGPAAYTIALAESTAVTGSYIAMSVYRPDWFPPIRRAKGRSFLLDHSPQDNVCKFSFAQQAQKELAEAGANVKLVTYEGGHGWHGGVGGHNWHGGVFIRVSEGLNWLVEQAEGRHH